MTATTDRCPGCHGSGIEPSGVTYAGMSEYVGCHECGPECPDDCGCRVSDDLALIAPPARDAVSDAEAARWGALADAVTEGSWTASGRTVLGDGYGAEYVSIPDTPADAAFIALARTAVPRLLADRERLVGANARMRQVAELRVGTWRDTAARLGGERDRAIGFATRVEAENARMVEWNAITTRAFETTRRVLQEASGLPDDIDDPDCRDEMVLALRPRAEKAEAEVARLREGIEALATEMQSDSCPACHAVQEDDWTCDHAEGMQHAGDLLRALLAEGGE